MRGAGQFKLRHHGRRGGGNLSPSESLRTYDENLSPSWRPFCFRSLLEFWHSDGCLSSVKFGVFWHTAIEKEPRFTARTHARRSKNTDFWSSESCSALCAAKTPNARSLQRNCNRGFGGRHLATNPQLPRPPRKRRLSAASCGRCVSMVSPGVVHAVAVPVADHRLVAAPGRVRTPCRARRSGGCCWCR